MMEDRPSPTRNWVEDEISDLRTETDKKITALQLRIDALERLILGAIGLSQEEMDRLLRKP